ncbi:MAG: hypothetical protein IKQ31_03315 [Clostridia bacterium]|nr:hypothetical protein [Clostridia bacterium]
MTLEQMLYYGSLLDFYGALLTSAQHDIVYDYIILNESLAEIAQNKDITKQAVSDVLGRALKKLDSYENALHIVAKFKKVLNKVDKVAGGLIEDKDLAKAVAKEYRELIKSLED